MQSLFCATSTQQEAGSLLEVLKKPAYKVARVRLAGLTKVSWCFVSVFFFLSLGRGKRDEGFTWRNLIDFERMLGITLSIKCPSSSHPPWGLMGASLHRGQVFLSLGALSPYPLVSCLFAHLRKLLLLPLAQHRDASPSSTVGVNISALMILPQAPQSIFPRKTVRLPSGVCVLVANDNNNSPNHMKITWDNVNESIFEMLGIAQIHSSIHPFVQQTFVKTFLRAGDAEINKMPSRISQSNEMLENNCNKV